MDHWGSGSMGRRIAGGRRGQGGARGAECEGRARPLVAYAVAQSTRRTPPGGLGRLGPPNPAGRPRGEGPRHGGLTEESVKYLLTIFREQSPIADPATRALLATRTNSPGACAAGLASLTGRSVSAGGAALGGFEFLEL